MARTNTLSARNLDQVWHFASRLPRPLQGLLVVLAVVGGLLYAFGQRHPTLTGTEAPLASQNPGDPAPSFLFCFWNVENLFDDKVDKRNRIDQPFDEGFAENDDLRKLKFDHIADAFMKMNGGKGPDIIACAEVESVRAAEILMGVLNARVKDATQKYKVMAMKNLNGGRHIAPCVITRLQMAQGATRLHGQLLRVLEAHVYANGHDLCIIATHWTSQLRQRDGGSGENGRANYARTINSAVESILKKTPTADVLVCGDFNEPPQDTDKQLHSTGNRKRVLDPNESFTLLNLMSDKAPDKFGTIFYDGKPLIYDQICVSSGLLDGNGWTCQPETVATVTDGLIRRGATRRQPWRFGDPGARLRDDERGYSDHFPVAVRLTAQPPAAKTKQD